jgi:hypothetical protein
MLAMSGFAQTQKIEVRDAGGGNKEELVRNSSGDVVETRLIDANGKLRSRDQSDYISGHFNPDQITTAYFPDGKTVQKTVKVTYDDSANFTSEIIVLFDESGKHIGGHKLLHDPVSGEFRCWNWSGPSQNYVRVVCPAGEESGEKPPPLKVISQQEAVNLLAAARTASTAQRKSERLTPKNPVTPPVVPEDTAYAIVLPANLTPGKPVSGSIADDPDLFRLRPDLIVQDITLPLEPGGEAAKLGGWRVEVGGAQPQRADGPFTFTVPRDTQPIEIKIYPEGQPAKAMVRSIPIPKPSTRGGKAQPGYVAQALCVSRDVCPIGGVFSGDASKALAAFNDVPAPIVAESTEMVFVRTPDDTRYGERQLLFNQGSELLVFPVATVLVDLVADGKHLTDFQNQIQQGEARLVFAGTIGVQSLPEENWRAGMFPASNLEWAQRLVPNFQVPRETHAQREEREKLEKLEKQAEGQKPAGKQRTGKQREEKLGNVVFIVKNATPEVVSWRSANNNAFVLPLNTESFSQGDYRYKFVVQAQKTGTYKVDVALIPFVAPARGQKFTLPAAAGQ